MYDHDRLNFTKVYVIISILISSFTRILSFSFRYDVLLTGVKLFPPSIIFFSTAIPVFHVPQNHLFLPLRVISFFRR